MYILIFHSSLHRFNVVFIDFSFFVCSWVALAQRFSDPAARSIPLITNALADSTSSYSWEQSSFPLDYVTDGRHCCLGYGVVCGWRASATDNAPRTPEIAVESRGAYYSEFNGWQIARCRMGRRQSDRIATGYRSASSIGDRTTSDASGDCKQH